MSRRLLLLAVAWIVAAAPAAGQKTTSCLICHRDPDLFETPQSEIVQLFQESVHAQIGLSCHDCHGGNPDPALGDDMFAAKDEGLEGNPYTGVPERTAIPAWCGSCHSDPAYMKRFRPDARVDQEREYRTSQHGVALERGDRRVANCVDCHGHHEILRADDPSSPVYPRQIAETCSSCHSDPQRMARSSDADGPPVPIDQYARWRVSVHAQALLEREDLSAPTCNDCHGNHGATPPGLTSINFVCGQCHGREAALFRDSAKREGQDEHNSFLADGAACGDCHEAPEPAAAITDIVAFSECATCHGHHGVVRPSLALLSPLPETPCAFCHQASPADGEEATESKKSREQFGRTVERLLSEAADLGLSADDRFDWLIDRAVELPVHTVQARANGDEGPLLRPEFERLYSKFRIGKIHYTYPNPGGEGEIRQRLRRCSDCHAEEPQLADDSVGHGHGAWLLNRQRELTEMTARAERILLAAKRGGVEVGDAALDLDRAIDSEVALQVLVHTFSDDADGEFVLSHTEGIEHASKAIAAGREGLGELRYRRTGLAVSLAFILAVLVGLGLKIRQLAD